MVAIATQDCIIVVTGGKLGCHIEITLKVTFGVVDAVIFIKLS